MHLFSGKKTKIIMKYEENTANCELSPYDTLSHLKQIITQFFPQITLDHILHLHNNSKPINEYNEYTKISELSKGKNTLKLTLSNPKRPLTTALDIKGFNTTTNSMSKSKCKCGLFSIGHYCSTCKEFSCSECQISLHRDHKSISIDVQSIDESVKLFAISLQADISNEMNNYIQIETMFKENMLIDFFSWKEMIIRKLNKIENFFKHFEEFEAIFKKKFGTIERMASQTSNKIENIINDYASDKNKKNIDKAKEVIEYLNESGKIIKVLMAENVSRREEFHTNNQINGLFADLDKIIDQVEALSLISYQEIKKRTENESKSGKSNPIALKREYDLFIVNKDKNDKGNNNLASYRNYDEKEQLNLLIKSKVTRNKLPKSMLDFTERFPAVGGKNKLHSVSVMTKDNCHYTQFKYLRTEYDTEVINEKQKPNNTDAQMVFLKANNHNVVLPHLNSQKD